MAEAVVRGVSLYYEVFGDAGPWVAFTPEVVAPRAN